MAHWKREAYELFRDGKSVAKLSTGLKDLDELIRQANAAEALASSLREVLDWHRGEYHSNAFIDRRAGVALSLYEETP